MTFRGYFGKMNPTLGSVVPLAMFSIENAKCWPNLANFDQFGLFCREFTEIFRVLFIDLNNAAVN